MNLTALKDIPPWDWPEGTGKKLLDVLRDNQSSDAHLLLATELAGDLTVIDDALVDALLSVLRNGARSEEIRATAAIALGPVLEDADHDGFEEWQDLPITEDTFHVIQESLQKLYLQTDVPKEVRRRILEASVRAPQEWHQDAVRAAFSSEDDEWKLTAVFCMRFIRGCDAQILETLDDKNPDIRYEAVQAAGNWQIDGAWPYVAGLVTSALTEKSLLLVAIAAAATIRPHEAPDILYDLSDSKDEDVVAAVHEAIAMARGLSDDDEDDEEELDDDDELVD
jgi:hypothetical protein